VVVHDADRDRAAGGADAVAAPIPVGRAEHGAYAGLVVVEEARDRERTVPILTLERRRRHPALARLTVLGAEARALFLDVRLVGAVRAGASGLTARGSGRRGRRRTLVGQRVALVCGRALRRSQAGSRSR